MLSYAASLFLPQLAAAQEKAAAAAKTPAAPAPTQLVTPAVAATDRQARELADIRAALGTMRVKAHAKKDVSKEKEALESLRQKLQQVDRDNAEQMRQVSQFLAAKNVPQVILQRQEEVARRVAAEADHVQSALTAIQGLDNPKALEIAANQLQSQIAHLHMGRASAPLDPRNLPFGTPRGEPRQASSSTAMLEEQHPDDASRRYLFAGAAGAGVTPQLAPNDPAYTSANGEVQITQAIKDQAAALHNNPVEIFNWVRNNIDFVPTYGSVQGSDLTLQALRGNAYDTSSLLIALLRAAGTPARYVYGSVQIPIAPLMSWAGGFDNPQAAVDFLGQGGIPVTALAQGGTIQAARIEHVWVEAWVSYEPGRGAKSTGGASTWVPLDASFKAYQDVAGVATTSSTPDVQVAVQNYLASAQTGDGGAWSTGFDPTVFDNYRGTLAANMTPSVLADPSLVVSKQILPTRTIVTVPSPVLPATLPYKLVARGGDYASLPDSLKVTAQIQLFTLDDETVGGSPLISQEISLPEAGYSSLELTYSAATSADAAAWAAYQTPGTTEFPAYLIQVKASLKLAGNDLQDSGALPFGQDMVLHVTYGGAAQPRDARFTMLSGDEVQVGLNGGGQAPTLGLAFQNRTDLDSAENNLFVAAKAFWTEADQTDAQIAQISRAAFARLPSAGTFSSPVSIVYNYGVPFKASYHGHGVDVKLAQYSAMSRDGDPQKTRAFGLISGMQLSSLEDTSLEVVFGSPVGKGVSTMALLGLANSSAMPIYHLTAANWGTYRGAIQQPADVLADIDNAIAAGLEVVIPQGQLTSGSWTGTGYIMLDPVTGSGDYRINGGASGSFTDSCGRQTQPVSIKVPDVSIIWEMILDGFVDDDLNFNGAGVAAVIALVVATAALVVVAGPAVAAAAAVAGRALTTAALVLTLGVAAVASAAEDTCSCTPSSVPRRGGNAVHNACADKPAYTNFPGSDRLLNGKNYDGQLTSLMQMTEVKTGTFYNTITQLALQGRPSAAFFRAALLLKQEALIIKDWGTASVCEFDYGYYAVDGQLVSDLRQYLQSVGSKVFPASCQ
jgi:transglutaminase-like putative cysteine protease